MKPKTIAFCAVIAALYATITYLSGEAGFTPLQLRPAEALTLLPFLFPQSMWGLFVGCAIANIISPIGVLDMIFGPLATLIAAFLTSKCKTLWMAAIPPIIINAIVVGTIIMIGAPDVGGSWPAAVGWIAVSQAFSAGFLGIVFTLSLKKLKIVDMMKTL